MQTMKILAAESNFQDLCKLTIAVARLFPKDDIYCAFEPEAALELSRANEFGIIFLAPDFSPKLISMLNVISPRSQVFFTSRPFSLDDILSKIQPVVPKRRKVYIQTFGRFDIFCDGKPLTFKRTKAKELLALLVDRRGSTVSTNEGCSLLFKDNPESNVSKSYYRILAAELLNGLRREGIDYIVNKMHNFMSVDVTSFECDAYQFLKGDPEAIGKYNGDYLSCYDWAEYSSAMFAQSKREAPKDEAAKPKPKRKPRTKRKTPSTEG